MISVQPLGFFLFFNPGSRCLPINIFLNWKLPWEVGGWSRYQTKGLAVSGLDLSLCLKALGNGNKYRSPKEWCGPEPELSKKDKENCLPTTIVKHLALCIWHAFNLYLLSTAALWVRAGLSQGEKEKPGGRDQGFPVCWAFSAGLW